MKRIAKLTLATILEKLRSGNYKMSDSALLGNTGLVPIDDVDQFPWILTKLNLQLALFVDR